MAKRTNIRTASFDDQLVLYRYFLHELRLDSLGALSEKLNSIEYEGVNESGNTYFYEYISLVCRIIPTSISIMMDMEKTIVYTTYRAV